MAWSQDLLNRGDQAGARDAITRARTSFAQAADLRSALGHEAEKNITSWLNRLDTLADAIETAPSGSPSDAYPENQARN
jgi:hypothetical protein